MKRMGKQWEAFVAATGLQRASILQQREMQRAFYAGAASFFGEIMSMLEPGIEPTLKDVMTLEELRQELVDFSDVQRAWN